MDIRVPDLAVHHRSKPNLAMTGVSYLDVLEPAAVSLFQKDSGAGIGSVLQVQA